MNLNLVEKITAIGIGAIFLAILGGLGISYLSTVNQTGWTAQTVTIWGVLIVAVVLAMVLVVFKTVQSKN